MADNNTPSRSANMEKAEGDRSTAEKNISQSESGSGASQRGQKGDNAGGISNRPLDQEVEHQAELPDLDSTDEPRRSQR